MIEDAPLLTPANADDLLRDPKRYTDSKVAAQSRESVELQDIESSLRTLFNLSSG